MALRLEITTPAYLNLEAKITDAEITEIYYARMVAAGISTKAASDNRRLTDALTGVDLQQTYVGKILSDTSLLTEAMSANIEQVRSESLNTSDTAIIALTFYRNLADAFAIDDAINLERIGGITKHNVANASDAHYWATTKVVIDAAAALDSAYVNIEQVRADAVSTADTVIVSSHYYRMLADAVAMYDAISVAGALGQVPHDITNASDTHYWAATKALIDTASTTDSARTALEKPLTESMPAFDTFSYAAQYHRAFEDALSVGDYLVMSGRELSSTSLTNISDAHYLSATKGVIDAASASDSASTALEKPLTESMAALDTFSYAAHYRRALEDVLSVSDIMLISDLDIGSISLANIRDQHALSINTNYTDAASLSDVHSFTASKLLTESIGATDYISFQFTNDKKPVFNGVTFNTSTFG